MIRLILFIVLLLPSYLSPDDKFTEDVLIVVHPSGKPPSQSGGSGWGAFCANKLIINTIVTRIVTEVNIFTGNPL